MVLEFNLGNVISATLSLDCIVLDRLTNSFTCFVSKTSISMACEEPATAVGGYLNPSPISIVLLHFITVPCLPILANSIAGYTPLTTLEFDLTPIVT